MEAKVDRDEVQIILRDRERIQNEKATLLIAIERLRKASENMGLGGSAMEYHAALSDLFDLSGRGSS